ncbi:MAG: hypothetical protein ABIB98_01980 [bacterium]
MYTDKLTIDSLLTKHKISTDKIVAVINQAAKDRVKNKISLKEFSLIAMNLYFEGYKRLTPSEQVLPKAVEEILEAFSDPYGKYLDKDGRFSKDMQESLLRKLITSSRN